MADNRDVAHNNPGTARLREYAWPAGLALLAALCVLILQIFVFRQDSLTNDENSYLFQAKILAAGRTWSPLPREHRLVQFPSSMINVTETRWFSRYPFGHPLALVPGVVTGYLLLTPLVMSAASVILVYLLGRQLYDEHGACLAAALTAVSPYFLAMHGTLLSHTTALFFFGLFALAFVRMLDSTGMGWALLAGASLGFLFNVRPFTATLMSWPFLLWGVRRRLAAPSTAALKQGLVFGLAAAVFVGAFLLYDSSTTGSWKVSPYSFYNPSETLGFGRVLVSDAYHTPERAVRHTLVNLGGLNRWWLGFSGSLWVLTGVLLTRWRWQETVLFLSGASLIVGYAFFWFGGIVIVGPVYYFEAILPLSLLGAHSMMTLWRKWPWQARPGLTVRTVVACLAIVVSSTSVVEFWRTRLRRLEHVFSAQRHLERALDETKPHDALVFLETGGTVWQAVRYEPFTELDVIFVRSRQRENDRVLAENPARQVYRYTKRQLQRVR